MLLSFERLNMAVRSATLTDGTEHWDYAQLCSSVDSWIEHFDSQQVQVVAFEVSNGLAWVGLTLALLESARVAVPIPSFFSQQQKQHAICDSGAQLFISDAGSDTLASADRLNAQKIPAQDALLSCRLTPVAALLPDTTALVTYTSGSTGEPKGVCLSAAHLLETAQAIVARVGSPDTHKTVRRHLCALPLTLLLENVAGLYANLLNGSEVRVPGLETLGLRGSSNLDIQQFVAGLHAHKPHSLILVPGQLLGLVTIAEWGGELPSSLKFVAVGGGKVAPSLLGRAAAVGLPVYEGYGLTECGSVLALNSPGEVSPGSVGSLLPHVLAQIIGGELMVQHPRLLGYVGAAAIDPSVNESVATGDLVTFDEQGFLRIHGRSKNTFITAYGRNLSPEWVESELQSEVAIAHAAVFGEAINQPVALLVLRDGFSASDITTAVQQVNARLPDYAQIADWALISLESLVDCTGLTPNGRLRRQVVATAYQTVLVDLYQQQTQELLHA